MRIWKNALLALLVMFVGTNSPAFSKPEPAGQNVSKGSKAASINALKDNEEGAVLFKKNCQNCHSTGASGGCLGPILAGEGARRSKLFIESRISSDPARVAEFLRLYGHAELMPHLRVEPAAARKLAAYVASLSAPKGGFEVRGHSAGKGTTKSKLVKNPTAKPSTSQASSSDAGKKLVYDRGCLMCHSFAGMGGQFAPSFDGIGSRRSQDYIAERISNAELLLGSSGREYGSRGLVMPSSNLTPDDINNISTYLSSLK